MNIESVSPLKKDGTPKKKTGRPSNAGGNGRVRTHPQRRNVTSHKNLIF